MLVLVKEYYNELKISKSNAIDAKNTKEVVEVNDKLKNFALTETEINSINSTKGSLLENVQSLLDKLDARWEQAASSYDDDMLAKIDELREIATSIQDAISGVNSSDIVTSESNSNNNIVGSAVKRLQLTMPLSKAITSSSDSVYVVDGKFEIGEAVKTSIEVKVKLSTDNNMLQKEFDILYTLSTKVR